MTRSASVPMDECQSSHIKNFMTRLTTIKCDKIYQISSALEFFSCAASISQHQRAVTCQRSVISSAHLITPPYATPCRSLSCFSHQIYGFKHRIEAQLFAVWVYTPYCEPLGHHRNVAMGWGMALLARRRSVDLVPN